MIVEILFCQLLCPSELSCNYFRYLPFCSLIVDQRAHSKVPRYRRYFVTNVSPTLKARLSAGAASAHEMYAGVD